MPVLTRSRVTDVRRKELFQVVQLGAGAALLFSTVRPPLLPALLPTRMLSPVELATRYVFSCEVLDRGTVIHALHW